MAKKPKGGALGRGLSSPAVVSRVPGALSALVTAKTSPSRPSKSGAVGNRPAATQATSQKVQLALAKLPGSSAASSSTSRTPSSAQTRRPETSQRETNRPVRAVEAPSRAPVARPVVSRPKVSAPPPLPKVVRGAALTPITKAAFEPKGDVTGADARKYPRAELAVKVRLSLTGDPRRHFEASLATANVSVGGLFLASTFFLKVGTLLDVEMSLPPGERVVRARGQVVRIETADSEKGSSGFALKFTEYLDGSEVVLATHFLAPVLREFIQEYARAHRLNASVEYIAHTADVLAAWELRKAELGGDVWGIHTPKSSSPKR